MAPFFTRYFDTIRLPNISRCEFCYAARANNSKNYIPPDLRNWRSMPTTLFGSMNWSRTSLLCSTGILSKTVALPKKKSPLHTDGILARRTLDISVANKLICSNVVHFDPGTHKRLAHGRHHSGRPSNVVNGSLQVGQMPAQHLLVYRSRLALPFFLGFRHFCHGADQAKIGICRLQSPQGIQESSVFGPPIGIEQV